MPEDYADMNREELIKLAVYQRERMEEMEAVRKEAARKNAELTDRLSALTEQFRKSNEAMPAMAAQMSELMRQLKAEREECAKLRSEVKAGCRHLFDRKSQKGTKTKGKDDENYPTLHTDVRVDFDGTVESLPSNYRKDGNYTIDNSLAERCIRPLANERKNSLFFGSDKMARVSAAYHSVVSTCKQQGYSIQEYLKKFFAEIVAGNRDYGKLMPSTIGISANKL